ncbi:MAG TPA: hypothetical protein VG168_15100, partial [Bryobacteraceae bacterium]|nr:hypothetical protein [Bryobacteraceae bacterium]
MHTPKMKPVRSALLSIALGSFILSPYLMAQETTSPNSSSPSTPPAPPAQTGTNPTGGWRRVGDPPPPP